MNAQNDRGYSGHEGLGRASPIAAAAGDAAVGSHHAKPLNVLLLEDNARDAELIQWTLAKRGVAFTMRLVDTKKGFVEALEATLPDTVLLDYGVPGYDGKRAFADLQRLCPGTPAIVVTGALGDEAAVDLLKLGIRDYVLKSNLARLGPAIEQAIAAAANVRAREAAERALHESEARMIDAIECISQPFVIYDREDRLIYCNDAFRRTFPHPGMADIRGMKFEDLIADSIARGTFKDVADFKTKWTATRTEMHRTASSTMDVVLADGRHFLATDRRMKSGGRAGLRVDVTELVRTKESLQIALAEAEGASRAKSAFLANMSHELRTPLNAIIGFSEMIKDQIMGPVGTPTYAEYADHIWKAGGHLHELLGDVLDLAKIEADAFDLRDERVAPAALIGDALATVTLRARQKSIAIETKSSAALENLRISGDELRLRQVLINLLSNAIKYTQDGGRVSIALEYVPGGACAFVITDTGVGMSADEITVAFRPFGRVGNVLSSTSGGAGLGLPLSLRLIELHGGTLTLDSVKGKGTTVVVTLPPERVIWTTTEPSGKPELAVPPVRRHMA